jgi:uncharacterized membrane protein
MTTPGILLGLGLGGFVDGILLHQIFQWHNMLSSTDRWARTTLEGMERNMLADGLFHLATWALVAAGVWALWSGMRHREHASGKALLGWALAGWGIFNLVEGIIDHQILGIHHVRDESLALDVGFLAFGVALIVVGWLLARTGERVAESP